ncbi:MAG: iron-containing redox enzyme family protein [Actinomycetota bacterium]|nr:iron-containing redox enzyme family protein [Actinomycetota bacterium]
MNLIDRIDAARQRWNVLEHPFYVRWERGELTPDDLEHYAGQYRHAVVALAGAAATAAPLAGRQHAEDEDAHIGLWDDFASAAGAGPSSEPLSETAECAAAWGAADDALGAAAVLYAIESGQPEISETKLKGLVEHYGFRDDTPATAYFELHAELDREHAREARALLEEQATPADEERLVSLAEGALSGNWALLDGVARA